MRCICANAEFLNAIGCCLLENCGPEDQQAAITYAADICNAQGVDVPATISCATATGNATDTTTETTEAASEEDVQNVEVTATSPNTGPTAPVGLGAVAAGVIGAVAIL